VRNGIVFVRCASCGAESALNTATSPAQQPAPEDVPAAAPSVVAPGVVDVDYEPAPPAPAVDLPPIKCPKCGHRQHTDESCDRCGLVFSNVRDGRKPWEEWPAELVPFVRRGEELWKNVEARPTDPAAHAAFVDYCRNNGIVALAATRYRHRLADHPGDAVSRSYLDRIIRDASAMAQAMTVPGGRTAESFKRVKNSVLIVVLVLSLIATAVLVRMTMATMRGMP
jgi:DNA-directed RNA polymerase subunit RPC12/RpoP